MKRAKTKYRVYGINSNGADVFQGEYGDSRTAVSVARGQAQHTGLKHEVWRMQLHSTVRVKPADPSAHTGDP